jgi:hypothetical protein
MKDQYVGDIGDYVKLAFLRAISPDHRLAVLWYLTPDDPIDNAGRFTSYLRAPDKWRHLDPHVFNHLDEIVRSNQRTVNQLEQLLPECRLFWRAFVPCPRPYRLRPVDRSTWFANALQAVDNHDCDLIFLDPDNGIQPLGCQPTHARAQKHVLLSELCQLREQAARHRTVIVYYHNTRRLGGHCAENLWVRDRMQTQGFRCVQALRARSHSPRTFFILDAPPSLVRKTADFAQNWRSHGVHLSEWPRQ